MRFSFGSRSTIYSGGSACMLLQYITIQLYINLAREAVYLSILNTSTINHFALTRIYLSFTELKHSTMINTTSISAISDIRFGLYAQPNPTGSTAYLQVRQFSEEGRLTTQPDEYINLDKKIEPHLLKDGDVLFAGKGNRLFSWCYRLTDHPAVASSIFFVLRPKQVLVYPEYLAAILNAPQSKASFQQLGSGTNIFSIRKSELGAFEIPLPPMQLQKRIAAVALLHQQEIELSQKIIAQKQALYTAIISKLIK